MKFVKKLRIHTQVLIPNLYKIYDDSSKNKRAQPQPTTLQKKSNEGC